MTSPNVRARPSVEDVERPRGAARDHWLCTSRLLSGHISRRTLSIAVGQPVGAARRADRVHPVLPQIARAPRPSGHAKLRRLHGALAKFDTGSDPPLRTARRLVTRSWTPIRGMRSAPTPTVLSATATAFVDGAGSLDCRVIHAVALTSARPPGERAKHHYSDQHDPPEHRALLRSLACLEATPGGTGE